MTDVIKWAVFVLGAGLTAIIIAGKFIGSKTTGIVKQFSQRLDCIERDIEELKKNKTDTMRHLTIMQTQLQSIQESMLSIKEGYNKYEVVIKAQELNLATLMVKLDTILPEIKQKFQELSAQIETLRGKAER